MAIRTIPPLLADGGDMTIMRHVASHAYGTLTVTYPDGVDAPEDNDLNQAYSYQLRDEDTPPFGRAFIRADLDIDAENNTSTVEEILDDVTTRTVGEALFQTDITRAGLGRLELGVDFNVGDLVPVRRWGRILDNQLITAADDLSSPGDPFGCRVHVGGQLIREPSALAKGNRDVARQIAQERKERLAQVKAVDKKAEDAKSTAETAQGTADGVEQDLHSTHVEPVEEGWYPAEEGWQGATETLNKNFLDFVSFQQDTNQRIQERVDEHERLIKQLQEAKTRALASTTRIVAGGPGTTLDHDGEFIRLVINSRDLTVEALGHWSGDIILTAVRGRTDTGDYATGEIPSPYQLQWRIPHPDYSRERVFTIPTTGPYTEWISAMVIAQIRPGTMIEELVPLSKLLPDRDTWDTVASFTTLTTGEHTIIAVVEWDKTTWQDTYGMHILANGNLLATTGVRTRVGPLVSIGDGGRRRWVLDVQDIHLDEETEITLQVWAGAPGETQRRIHDGELRVWWIDTGEENNTIEEIP